MKNALGVALLILRATFCLGIADLPPNLSNLGPGGAFKSETGDNWAYNVNNLSYSQLKAAASFTIAQPIKITSIDAPLKCWGDFAPRMFLTIATDGGGLPNHVLFRSETAVGGEIDIKTFLFPEGTELAAGTYWIIGNTTEDTAGVWYRSLDDSRPTALWEGGAWSLVRGHQSPAFRIHTGPDIVARELKWDYQQNGVVAKIQVVGTLPQNSRAGLYWDTGEDTWPPNLPGPMIWTTVIPSAQQTYTFFISADALQPIPSNDKPLVLIVDDALSIDEFDESNNTALLSNDSSRLCKSFHSLSKAIQRYQKQSVDIFAHRYSAVARILASNTGLRNRAKQMQLDFVSTSDWRDLADRWAKPLPWQNSLRARTFFAATGVLEELAKSALEAHWIVDYVNEFEGIDPSWTDVQIGDWISRYLNTQITISNIIAKLSGYADNACSRLPQFIPRSTHTDNLFGALSSVELHINNSADAGLFNSQEVEVAWCIPGAGSSTVFDGSNPVPFGTSARAARELTRDSWLSEIVLLNAVKEWHSRILLSANIGENWIGTYSGVIGRPRVFRAIHSSNYAIAVDFGLTVADYEATAYLAWKQAEGLSTLRNDLLTSFTFYKDIADNVVATAMNPVPASQNFLVGSLIVSDLNTSSEQDFVPVKASVRITNYGNTAGWARVLVSVYVADGLPFSQTVAREYHPTEIVLPPPPSENQLTWT